MSRKFLTRSRHARRLLLASQDILLDQGTNLSYHGAMNGTELLRKLKKLAKERQIAIRMVKSRGKGSHATLVFGGQFTTVKDLKKEIGPGLLGKMLQDLGLERKDIE